ncbi:FecR family protein [Pedobacter nutrimenti]|uniref:FecR family protein n=1 Tax=Pedobacter nutrimenti TaxID=1241337 RepID=A0A318UCD9_9SPHI|nr:FecR domain-containing protein [Pedobacter nutrimenti]PYF72912.1 FecR family protein [Pedobacter nutrimenti]
MQEEFNEENPGAPLPPFYKRWSFRYLLIACLALLATAIGAAFYKNHPDLDNISYTADTDFKAGGPKATLILGNGFKISLTAQSRGEIDVQQGVRIRQINGELIYELNRGLSDADTSRQVTETSAVADNEIFTPRGGTYKLVLADGTKVWLNAASSLRYPAKFSDTARIVELKGEAYFEIAKTGHSPFKVKVAKQIIEAENANFNISTYADDHFSSITLVSGQARLMSPEKLEEFRAQGLEKRIVLEPGEQAVLDQKGLKLEKVHPEEAVSWKNGYFQFNNASLKNVMRQMSRWYDADVIYEGEVPDLKFSGEVRREASASTFLEMMAYLKLRFKIRKMEDGRREVVVRPAKSK